jgi:mannose-6-phosphate isomerase-like protein (cupin superfamily)
MSTLHDCAAHGERFEGGLGIRDVILSPEHPSVDLHAHRFDHVMFFAEGAATVTAFCPCGSTKVYDAKAGTSILIPATWTHAVQALTDRVKFWCVFPAFDATGARQGDYTAEAP